MSKATEMTPEQKAPVGAQVAAFPARCQAWVIELTVWRILSILVGAIAGLTLIVPEWRVWSLPALTAWGIFVVCTAYVFFSLPKN